MEKTLEMHLAEQREAIAQEIETRLVWKDAPHQINSAWNKAVQKAAEIAREQK